MLVKNLIREINKAHREAPATYPQYSQWIGLFEEVVAELSVRKSLKAEQARDLLWQEKECSWSANIINLIDIVGSCETILPRELVNDVVLVTKEMLNI